MSYHAPAVAPHQKDAVIQNSTARTTATLQYWCLEDVPLVSFWVITLNQHNIKVRKTCLGNRKKINHG